MVYLSNRILSYPLKERKRSTYVLWKDAHNKLSEKKKIIFYIVWSYFIKKIMYIQTYTCIYITRGEKSTLICEP